MKEFFKAGKKIGFKSYKLCRIVINTIVALTIICWNKLRNTVVNWTIDKPGMSRQMGAVVCSCQKHGNQDELCSQLKEQIKKNGMLEEEVDKLRKKIEIQNDMIEKQFGKDIEITAKGKCNNTGEVIQPATLSYKIKTMFDQEWRSVMKTLFGTEKELTGIKFLSEILEDCQSFCQTKANEQLLKFVNPCTDVDENSVEEVITSSEHLHYLYKLRRTVGLHESNSKAVVKLFSAECKKREDFRSVTEEIQEDEEKFECLQDYIKSCCDLCWQSAISDPAVLLKFDVRGKHINEVNENFQTYPYKGQTEEEGVSDTVMQVVWPAVVMKDGDIDILINNAKGFVIIYSSSAV